MRSKSSERGSLRTFLGVRPNSFSRSRSLSSNDSGVSVAGMASSTTEFTNGGESGGQSTGLVRQGEDLRMGSSEKVCSRSIASRIIWRGKKQEETQKHN